MDGLDYGFDDGEEEEEDGEVEHINWEMSIDELYD